MLHPETLEGYRRMTTSQRLQLTLDMTSANARNLFRGTPEVVERRLQIIRIQNEDRNRRMLTGIARSRNENG